MLPWPCTKFKIDRLGIFSSVRRFNGIWFLFYARAFFFFFFLKKKEITKLKDCFNEFLKLFS